MSSLIRKRNPESCFKSNIIAQNLWFILCCSPLKRHVECLMKHSCITTDVCSSSSSGSSDSGPPPRRRAGGIRYKEGTITPPQNFGRFRGKSFVIKIPSFTARPPPPIFVDLPPALERKCLVSTIVLRTFCGQNFMLLTPHYARWHMSPLTMSTDTMAKIPILLV